MEYNTGGSLIFIYVISHTTLTKQDLFMHRNDNDRPRLLLAVHNWDSLISCTVISHFHYHSPHAFDSRGNKRKTKPRRVFMMEDAVHLSILEVVLSLSLLKSKCTSVLIDNPSNVSFQSFPMHLYSPSATPLFPLTAFSIASLNQPCQVYKYNDKSGNEFEGGFVLWHTSTRQLCKTK